MHNHIQAVLSEGLPRRDVLQWVLGLVTHTRGSTYRKAGAMMMISELGHSLGLLSGGCLERALLAEAKRVLAFNRPRNITFDATQQSDVAWQLGLGCGGSVTIRLLPVSAQNEYLKLDKLLAHLQARRSVLMHLPLRDEQSTVRLTDIPGYQAAPRAYERSGNLCVTLVPRRHLVIFGAGTDTVPLAHMAAALDWQLTLVEHRQNRTQIAAFPANVHWLHCEPDAEPVVAQIAQADAALVMTHNLELDSRALHALVGSGVRYIGLLGPAHRKVRVLELAGLNEQDFPVPIEGPMGLLLGGELPESVALSALARCHQVLEQSGSVQAAEIVSSSAGCGV